MKEVLDIFGIGGWAGEGVAIDFSGFKRRVNGVLKGESTWAGKGYILHDERTFEDAWGIVRRVGSDSRYVEWVSGPLVNARNPDEYDFPTPDRLIDDPELPERVRTLKQNGMFVTAGMTNPYKRAWLLRGMENLLADYILHPRFVAKLYDRIYALYEEQMALSVRAGVEMISISGDIAMSDRIIMGADRWRRFDKPRLARLIARCKRINPDLHVFIHSDGNILEIMEDLIGIGFNVIDPIQPECMDPVMVKERFGERIVLHGGGSVQKTLPLGTVDDVRREVIRLIEKCGYNGGLVIRPSNIVGDDTPLENVLAFFETARDYTP